MTFNIVEIVVLLLINTFSIFLIIVVLSKPAYERLYSWFVAMTILLMGWVNLAYIGYRDLDVVVSISAYRLNGAFVAAFFFAIYMFYIECFLKINKPNFRRVLMLVSSAFVFIALFTEGIIKGVVRRDWGNEIIFGPINDIFSLFSVIVTSILVYYFIAKYFSLPKIEKRKVQYFLVGTFSLVIFNVIFNVLSPLILNTAQFQHLGDYSAGIFLAFTAFAMLRYKFLDVKVALTAALISVIGILLVVDILILSNSLLEQGVKVIMLAFFIGISNILIRSVMTEIKQKEKLAEAYQDLNDIRRFEQDMIDVMGHELRTPMSIVRNALSLMEMELKSKGEISLEHQKKYVGMGLEASRREVNLIETLLSATKSEGKGFQLILDKVNLIEIINTSVLAYTKEAEKKGLSLKFENNTKELYAYCDKTRVQEISDNFLSNAIKYTEKGEVIITTSTQNNLACISFKDTGVGISEEDIKKLGQKFFRAQQYTDEEQNQMNIVRPGGTGLGLFVAFSLIKVMEGDLKIESKVGVGSNFTFGMPLYSNQERKQVSRNAEDYKQTEKSDI